MNEDDYSDITVIKIYTEKELNAEYESLNTLLIDTNADWSKRFNAIKRLEGLILGGAYQLDGFPSMMAKLSLHFTAQLNDLRSAVSKEACRLVCLAAKMSQEKLEPLSDKLIHKEGLIKLINSANKVIYENGHECILTLLENVRSPKIIPRLVDEVSNKNTALRQKIALYFKIIMEIYPDSVIEKNATALENAIVLFIADANKEVRQFTRQTFLIYQERFPSRATKLQSKFDNSVQKALTEEAKEFSYTGERPIEKYVEKPQQKISITKETKPVKENNKRDSLQQLDSEKKPESEKKPTRDSMNSKRPVSSKDKGGEYVSKEVPNFESSNENKFSSKPQTADVKKGKPLAETQEDRTNNHRGVVTEATQISPEKKRSSSIYQAQNNNTKPPERDKSASKVLQNTMSTSAPLPKKEESNVAKSQNFDRVKFEDKEKESSTRPSSTSSGAKRPDSNYNSTKELSGKKEKTSIKNEISKEPLMNNFYQSIKEEDLKFLIDKSNDENWAVRSNSFEKINEFISDLKPGEHISNNLLEELIETHIQHINDFHYKVIISCQESFSKIITIYKQKILSSMDKIIPPIFLNLTEGKEKVYQTTNFVLNLINKIYTGDELFPHFFRSLDFSQKAKYRASILEFMSIVLRNCKTYFNAVINIRTCIIKFAMLMAEFCNNKNIIMPCLGMILYLRDINFNVAMSAITTLNQAYLSNLRGLASQYATDLDENIRYFNYQQKNASKDNRPQSPRKEITQEVIKETFKEKENNKKPKEESKSFGPVHEMSGIARKPSNQDDFGNQVNEEEEEDEDEEERNENDEENDEEHGNGEEQEEEEDPNNLEEEKGEEGQEEEEQEDYENEDNEHQEDEEEENEEDELGQENEEEEEEEEEQQIPEPKHNNKRNYQQEPVEKKPLRASDKPPMPTSMPDIKEKKETPAPTYNYQKSLSSDKIDNPVDIIKNHDSPYEIAQPKKSGVIKKNQVSAAPKKTEEEIPSLEKIDAIINDYPKKKAYIEKNLDNLICQILEFFTAKEQSIIEYAMDILRKLLKLPFNFGMQIDQLLSCLISLYYSPFKFSSTVDDMIRIVLNLGYADLCMHSMIENLEREDHPVLQILIKNITGMFVKKADPEINKFLPDLILKYKTLINHQNPDVRKNVVFSIVDLHASHPNEMQEFISEFSASHQKLIAIYIQKRSEKKGAK